MTVKAKEAESKELTNWEERMAAKASDVASTERPSVATISFKSGVMTYMGKALPNNELECIILTSVTEHVLYLGDYDPDNMSPPDCFALTMTGSDKVLPHLSVKNPQHENCNNCPKFQWGSGRGRGKACSEKRRLAILPGTTKEEEVGSAEVAIAKIPVTSVKNWSNYVNLLAAQYNRPPWGVITKLKVVPDAKTQIKVVFEPIGIIKEPGMLAALDAREATVMNILMTPYDMTASATEETPKSDKY